MPLGTEVGLDPGHTVLDGDPAPPNKGHVQHPLHFSAHVYSGETDGWFKMPLGNEVDLALGHIVLDGDPVRCFRGLWPNGRPSQLLLSACKLLYQLPTESQTVRRIDGQTDRG